MAHQNWTHVSFVSFVSVFVSWQCLYLTDPNMSYRYASVFIKARLRYFLPVWLAAICAKLQNHNRVSLSIPLWWFFLFYSFNYEEWNMGLDIFRALFLCAQSILFLTISRFVEFSSHKLINQVETVGLLHLKTKWPIFSTKKNFTPRYLKKKSSTTSWALSVQQQWSLFHLRAAFNEINPLLTVTWDESKRHKAGKSSGKVLQRPTYPPTHPA